MTAAARKSLTINQRNFYKKALCGSEKLDVEVESPPSIKNPEFPNFDL